MEEDGLTLLLWQRLKRVNNLSPLNSNHQQLNTPCYAHGGKLSPEPLLYGTQARDELP